MRTTISLLVGTIAGLAFYLPSIGFMPSFKRFGDTDLWQALYLHFAATPVPALLMLAGVALSLRQWRRNRYVRLCAACILLPVLITIAQYALTGRTLYARNYLYLVPLMCVAASMALRWRKALAVACCVGALVVVLKLRELTLIDYLVQVKRVYPDLVLGCCVEEPVRYEVARALADAIGE